jgi:hypothetical protein
MRVLTCSVGFALCSVTFAVEPIEFNVQERELFTFVSRYAACGAYPEHSRSLYPRTLSNGLFNGAAVERLFGPPSELAPLRTYQIKNGLLTANTEKHFRSVISQKTVSDSLRIFSVVGDPSRLTRLSDQEMADEFSKVIENSRTAELKSDFEVFQWDLKVKMFADLSSAQQKEASKLGSTPELQESIAQIAFETSRQRDRLIQKHPLVKDKPKTAATVSSEEILKRNKAFREKALEFSKRIEPEVSAEFNQKCTKEEFRMLRKTLNQITNGRLEKNEMDYVNERFVTFPEIARPLKALYEDLAKGDVFVEETSESAPH